MLKKINYWAGVIIIGVVLGAALQFVKAWSEPSVAPPGGNVAAPINVGSLSQPTDQTKYGSLGVTGSLKASGGVAGSQLCFGADCKSSWAEVGGGGGTLAGSSFGNWKEKVSDKVYKAATDGFVTAYTGSFGYINGYTDNFSPPTTKRIGNGDDAQPGIMMPVKKGDYWKVTGAGTVFWLPAGGDTSAIVLNSRTASSCDTVCQNNGGKTCESIGTDTAGFNNKYYDTAWGSACQPPQTGNCSTVISGSALGYQGDCGGNKAAWTNCNCI